MTTTRLSDVIVPAVFNPYMFQETTRQSAVLASGIMRTDPNIVRLLSGGGTTFNIPFWKDLTRTSANISNDNPASVSTPQNISADKQVVMRQERNQSWGSMDLSAELAGDDPMKIIGTRVGKYWADEFQSVLVASLFGVYQTNVASNGGDFVRDIATDAVGAPAAAELISPEAIIDTKQTMGDAGKTLKAMIMHSVCYSRLQKLNLIQFMRGSDNNIEFPTYLGQYRIIVDDGVKTVSGTNRVKYHTILCSEGAVGFGEAPAKTPSETFRRPDQGNGSGADELYTRRNYAIHPYGHKWNGASMAASFPTDAELGTASNWTRVFPERKQVGLAFLITNG